ncbi:hypothetical protein VYU27_007101 [Nannochloropsis oceanica]
MDLAISRQYDHGLGLTALVRQPVEGTHVEAILGIVASLEGHSVRTLECRRRDGTTFTSSLRSLHLQDEGSIVKLSLWGQRLADEAGGRLRKGDLLLATHVGIDRFMGEKGFKASGRRPQLTVIPSRAEAPRLLQRAVCQGREVEGDREERLELYRSLLARAEALWHWKEVEDMRQADRERQAARRPTAMVGGGGEGGIRGREGGGREKSGGYEGKLRGRADIESSGGGYEGLMVGREDGEVRGIVREWQWRTRAVREGGEQNGGGGRVIVFKLVDARGVGHVLEFPEEMEGVGQLECALQRRDALRRMVGEEEEEEEEAEEELGEMMEEEEDEEDEGGKVQVVVSNVGCVVLAGGMMAPTQTAKTCLSRRSSSSSNSNSTRHKRIIRIKRVRRSHYRLEHPASPWFWWVRWSVSTSLPMKEGRREGGREGEEQCLPEVGEMAAVLVKPKPRMDALGELEEGEDIRREERGNKWVYRDLILLVADPPSSAPSSLPSSSSFSSSSSTSPSFSPLPRRELRVRVKDACLQPLVGHIPAARLVEEAQADADGKGGREGGKRRHKTLHTTAQPFFYTTWVRRALLALASPSNPPWKLTTRVRAIGGGKEERTREEGGGDVSVPHSTMISTVMEEPKQRAELLLVHAAVAPPLAVGHGEGEEKRG